MVNQLAELLGMLVGVLVIGGAFVAAHLHAKCAGRTGLRLPWWAGGLVLIGATILCIALYYMFLW